MKQSKSKASFLLIMLVFICPVKFIDLLMAQDFQPDTGVSIKSLFQSDELLKLTLTKDMKSVFGNREAEESHPAEISYLDAQENRIILPLKVRVRGNFRKDSSNCDFPPLRLNFADTIVENTIFDGQDKIKLVTHCRSGHNLYEQNVLKEYLVYRLYNLFAEESYLVRLIQLTYADATGNHDTLVRMGFLIEPTSQMVKRNGCEILVVNKIQQSQTNRHKTTVLAVFQYMIGNTDWSVWVQHNTILLKEGSSAVPIVVPYDFDWSGLVNAPYAIPAGSLRNVKSRIYRNFCVTDAELQLALDEFRQNREKIYQTCMNVPFLSKKEIRKTLKYLDDFFDIIENPKKVESEMHQKCRPL